MSQTVAILGGGVGGLSAAHELAERGFRVGVFERKPVMGGKARSIPVPDSAVEGHKALPGEHGFRFFPGFYKHVTDTMQRIPYGDHGSVFGNLAVATRILLARAGQAEITWLARTPATLEDFRAFLMELFTPLGVPSEELVYFITRLLIVATSCAERRLTEFENINWWDFIAAPRMSKKYQAYLGQGLTRSLVAMRAEESSTRTVGVTQLQLLYGLICPERVFDRLLTGPTNDVWIDPWTQYLGKMFGKVVPLLDESGKARGAVGGFLDVTARKLAEERLRRTQKLESIGLLAGGVAHDFNNILTVISGNVSLAIHDLCPRCEIRSLLEVAIESAGRAAGLTRQLLAYAGKGAFTRMRVSISEVAQRAVRSLQSSVPKRVELRTELAPNLPPLLMDPNQMEQVLINLILNGTEAIGEHGVGVVTVRTDGANGSLRLLVSDTGAGMEQATQERMFEPFFTTRFTGRGLGLAAVDGIVRSLNGQISVDSAPGQGTRIQIVLPIADTQVVSHGPVAADPTRAAARGAILVVDDEPQIRKMAAAILRKADIDVLEASTGKEAIAILAEKGSDVRAVLLDLAMPELTGDQALPALFKLRPDIHVIVSSGYSDAEVKRYFRDHVNVRSFLPKPYGGEQLIAQVMAAIGGRQENETELRTR